MYKKFLQLTLFFTGLLLAVQVQAIGLGIDPARFDVVVPVKKTVEVKLKVFNQAIEPGIFDVYADELSEWFTVNPKQFRLDGKSDQVVSIKIKPSITGKQIVNLSVVGRSLERQSFNAASGLKVPIEINVLPRELTPVWLWYIFIGLIVVLLVLIYLVVKLERRRKHPFRSALQDVNHSLNWLPHHHNKWYYKIIRLIKKL